MNLGREKDAGYSKTRSGLQLPGHTSLRELLTRRANDATSGTGPPTPASLQVPLSKPSAPRPRLAAGAPATNGAYAAYEARKIRRDGAAHLEASLLYLIHTA